MSNLAWKVFLQKFKQRPEMSVKLLSMFKTENVTFFNIKLLLINDHENVSCDTAFEKIVFANEPFV